MLKLFIMRELIFFINYNKWLSAFCAIGVLFSAFYCLCPFVCAVPFEDFQIFRVLDLPDAVLISWEVLHQLFFVVFIVAFCTIFHNTSKHLAIALREMGYIGIINVISLILVILLNYLYA